MKKRVSILALLLAASGPLSAAEICATMGATQFVDSEQYCVSSVLAPQAGNRYGPENLFDGDRSTAWCEGVQGTGAGQYITLTINGAPQFSRLIFENGYGKSQAAYWENARIRTVEVLTDTGIRVVGHLPDSPLESYIDLPRLLNHRQVRITILDVYPGTRYSDTCLSALAADFEAAEQMMNPMVPVMPRPYSPPTIVPAPGSVSTIEDLPDLPPN